MKNSIWFLGCVFLTILSSCIGDDVIDDAVEPIVRIENLIDSIQVGTDYQFEASFLNNVGKPESVPLSWSSSDSDVVSITDDGTASALNPGSVIITVFAQTSASTFEESFDLNVGASTTTVVQPTSRSGVIRTTSSYDLTGDFTIEEVDGSLVVNIAENYRASTALPGLYVYLTNNPNTIAGALEIGAVEVFEGAHAYSLASVGLNDYNHILYYCKPFNVKVGDGEIQ